MFYLPFTWVSISPSWEIWQVEAKRYCGRQVLGIDDTETIDAVYFFNQKPDHLKITFTSI